MNQTNFFGKVKVWAIAHKIMATIVVIIVVLCVYGIWKHYSSSSSTTRYILTSAAKGTLIMSVSGSGQVAAVNQENVLSQVSGTITGIDVVADQSVADGQTLATIDDSDAVRSVNNAQLSLENAQVAYQKAVKDNQDQSATSTVSDLATAYTSGYNALVAAAIDLPGIFSTLNSIYYTPSHSPYFTDVNMTTEADQTAVVYKNQAGISFDDAQAEFEANFQRYKDISQSSSPDEITSLLNETSTILSKLLGALSGTYSTLDYVQNKMSNIPNQLTIDKAAVSSAVSKVNSDSSSVTNSITSIGNAQTSGTTADLGMKSAELTVQQDQAALVDAQTTLSEHSIVAPFAGEIAKVIANKGDNASVGTQIVTIVTKEQMVNISLNEIDAAKVAVGNKATLTFDAISDLNLTGHVTNVDLVGTVSQGVVSYNVQIAFDSVDPRVKPGMTVNANIITNVDQDVLIVPSSAVKTQNSTSYVQEFNQKYTDAEAVAGIVSATAPLNIAVTVGDSNDSQVEITAGLNEGDQVVSKTTTSTVKASAAPSILSSLTGGRTGGAAGAGGGALRAATAGAGAARGN